MCYVMPFGLFKMVMTFPCRSLEKLVKSLLTSCPNLISYNTSLCHIDSFMILKQGWSPVNIMAITCQHYFEAEFLSLNTMDILGWIIFVAGTVLCLMGCAASSLASTTRQSRNLSPNYQGRQRCLWTFDMVGKIHCFKMYCT